MKTFQVPPFTVEKSCISLVMVKRWNMLDGVMHESREAFSASLVEYLARSQPIPQDLGLLLLSSFSLT